MPQTLLKQRHCEGRYLTQQGAWCTKTLWTRAETERFLRRRVKNGERAEIVNAANMLIGSTRQFLTVPRWNWAFDPAEFDC